MIIALYILFIVCPLLPLLPSTHWTIRFFDFVRLQTAAIQVVLLIAGFLLWDDFEGFHYILMGLLAGVLAYQLWLIQPYTPFYHRRKPKQEFHKDKLTLITANVLQTNDNYEKFISIIKKHSPDAFITMESDQKWEDHLSKAFPEFLHTVKVPLDNFYGMHLFSKIPFKKAEVKYLVEKDIPSIHCELEFADQRFNLIAIHPSPPSPTENETSKERDAELMIVGKLCRETVDATIVCGDLNDVVWSKTSRLFTKITGYYDPRVGRGLYPSFHAQYWLLRFPLDHLFYSKDLHVEKLARLEPFGSDHFAMYYEIAFPKVDIDVVSPEISGEENNEVNEIIEEGHLSAKASEAEHKITLGIN